MDGIGYKDLTLQLLGVAKAKAGRVKPAFSGRRASRTSGGSDILFFAGRVWIRCFVFIHGSSKKGYKRTTRSRL